jgi:Domain of unknown function (DUF4395)
MTPLRAPTMRPSFGETIEGLSVDGQRIRAAVFDENAVRAAAGLTLALGSVAFAYAYFAKVYVPIQSVTVLFSFEFALRLVGGLRLSPLGWLARALVRRREPEWVSAKPKRFAWTLGLVMALAMAVITNAGIRGPLPLTICLLCLALMWLEAVLGLCLGCEIYRLLVGKGWAATDAAFERCAGGNCATEPGHD